MDAKRAMLADMHPDLFTPSHYGSRLIHLLIGDWRPDAIAQEALVTHLTECEPCRMAFVVLLVAEQEYERSQYPAEVTIRNLLARIIRIQNEMSLQGYELRGAYAETIVSEGETEAARRFPILAEHLKGCSVCREAIDDTVSFLHDE